MPTNIPPQISHPNQPESFSRPKLMRLQYFFSSSHTYNLNTNKRFLFDFSVNNSICIYLCVKTCMLKSTYKLVQLPMYNHITPTLQEPTFVWDTKTTASIDLTHQSHFTKNTPSSLRKLL